MPKDSTQYKPEQQPPYKKNEKCLKENQTEVS